MKKIGHIIVIQLFFLSCLAALFIMDHPSVEAYTPHDPIDIVGNEDFTAQAESEGWPGDGSEADPFIIEGYEIEPNSDSGIDIESTSVHFIIRDSLIRDGSVSFNNVITAVYDSVGYLPGRGVTVLEKVACIDGCAGIVALSYHIVANSVAADRIRCIGSRIGIGCILVCQFRDYLCITGMIIGIDQVERGLRCRTGIVHLGNANARVIVAVFR